MALPENNILFMILDLAATYVLASRSEKAGHPTLPDA
jgi:hypothetical protein